MEKFKQFLNTMVLNVKLKKILKIAICFLTAFYIFSIPTFSGRETYNIISYVAMALLMGTSIIYIIFFKDVRFSKKTLFLPGFVLFAFFGTLFFSHAFRDYLTLILLTFTFYALLVAFSIINDLELILKLFTFAFLAFALYFVFHYRSDILNVSKFTGESFRLGWDFDNPNTIGTFMTISVTTSLYLALFGKRKLNYLFLLTTLLFFLVGFTTGSRTFIVLSALSLLLLLIFKFKKHWLILLIILAGLLAVFIILLNTPLLATVKYRILDTIAVFNGINNGGTFGSTGERLLWQRYGNYFGSYHMLFGLGTNGFSVFSGTHTYTHGNFSEVLCDFGLSGFILFYLSLLIPAVLSILSKKKERFFVVTAVSVFLIEGFLTVYYYSKVTFVLLAICYFVINNDTFSECIRKHKKKHYEKHKLIYSGIYELEI